MRTIDANAFANVLRNDKKYMRLLMSKETAPVDVLSTVIVDLEGTGLDGYKNAPTVSAEPQWIPCSERLPEDLEAVNVTWVNHNPEPYYSFAKDVPFTASAIYYKGRWFWYSSVCADVLAEYGNNHSDEVDNDVEITAWTPLPKAYKGDT